MDKYLNEETRLNLVRRSRNFAVACLSCSLVMYYAPAISLGLGFFSILFAFLSKGYRPKMDKEAVTAVKFALAGIVIGGALLFASIYRELNAPANVTGEITSYKDSYEAQYEQQFEEKYGVKPSEIIDKLLGGGADEQ